VDSDQIGVYLQAETDVYFNSLRNFSDSDKVIHMINLSSTAGKKPIHG